MERAGKRERRQGHQSLLYSEHISHSVPPWQGSWEGLEGAQGLLQGKGGREGRRRRWGARAADPGSAQPADRKAKEKEGRKG